MLRSHTCGELRVANTGETATVCGWVETVRDHGGIVFIDLRDRYGLTQVVFYPADSVELRDAANLTRAEFVLEVTGEVEPRPDDMINTRLPTGDIEVRAHSLKVLNSSKTPPFPLEESKAAKVQEDLRMTYRFLDIRRPSVLKGLRLRHKMAQAVRNFMDEQEFIEVETPILTKSTPEGARDYLVPNRVTPGTFYALPQAPQQYKQLLMVAGVDRYFQMARCFRDEDLRADRQPEFTQIDVEMSFVEMEDIYQVIDGVLDSIMDASGHGRIELPIPRMSWHEAMDRFGSDKPDTRFGMELCDIGSIFGDTQFKVFGNVLASGGVIKAINAKGLSTAVPVRVIDEWTDLAKEAGMGGLAYIRVQEDGTWKSPITKFFSEQEIEGLRERLKVEAGDLVLFAAQDAKKVNPFLGKIRLEVAELGNVIPEGRFDFLWVTEFPLFEETAEGRMVPMHHPFTSALPEDIPLLETEPLAVRARAYDIVLNGVELGSGSIRIHDQATQQKMFEALKIDADEIKDRFGHLLDALAFGAPPHGGIALGFDRLAMLMAGSHSIRDVIAFPKNHKGVDLMMQAPAPVDAKQLQDVHLQLDLPGEDGVER